MVRSILGFFDNDFFTIFANGPNYSMLVVRKHQENHQNRVITVKYGLLDGRDARVRV
tara:strand:- start:245 stop:415 length:171 start_codon:yes stop_codon:yes gene_type:complete